jgi:hypothetical protein
MVVLTNGEGGAGDTRGLGGNKVAKRRARDRRWGALESDPYCMTHTCSYAVVKWRFTAS